MTYARLKKMASGLLVGDNKLPKDPEEVLALLEMAYIYITDKCQVLNLQTLDKSADVQRLGRGNYLVRMPDLPVKDTDELDIDTELGPVVASLISSYISVKKTAVHQTRADEGIRNYNAKVDELIESLPKLQGEES
jgi:hypothetical protein